jgi:hypothetical protein
MLFAVGCLQLRVGDTYIMQPCAYAGGAEDTKYRAIDGLTWFELLGNLAIVPKAEDGG